MPGECYKKHGFHYRKCIFTRNAHLELSMGRKRWDDCIGPCSAEKRLTSLAISVLVIVPEAARLILLLARQRYDIIAQ